RATGRAPTDGPTGAAARWGAATAWGPAWESARTLSAGGRSVAGRGRGEHGGDPSRVASEGLHGRRLDSPGLRSAQARAARRWPGGGATRGSKRGRAARRQRHGGAQPPHTPGQPAAVHSAGSTLTSSRRFHFWATECEDAEHTYEALVRAFEWFGGAPAEVLVDNQKAAVIAHRRGGDVQFHPRFVDLAGHYGFRPRACRPARAQTKGKDERNVGYVKHHFFVRYRAFESWAHLNQLAEQWLRQEADPRVHGTVREVVAERFAREVPTLQPLPPRRYDTAYWESRQVGWDAYVEIRGNRYSVPAALAGHPVRVRLTLDGTVAIYDGEQCVAQHHLQSPAQGWVTVPDHHTALWADTLAVEQRPLAVYEEVATWN